MVLKYLILNPLIGFVLGARQVMFILAKTLLTCLKGPHRPRDVLNHMNTIGCGSLPIIAISTAFAGFVVTGELAHQMDTALHTVEMLPGFSGQFVFRELGIVIPALLLVSKVGAATTAEVGSMKVTEQIDALRLLQIDPVEYLVYPRFVASIVVIACLTLISIFVTLSAAIAVAVLRYNFSIAEYVNALAHFVSGKDVVCALVKGMTFGAVMPIISCFYGFNCGGGAEGVGSATTNSVVTSTIIVIVLDFLLTFAFSMVL
ncbi:MAG: ABC transporter permease [Deltaproteobacteria bacterium]|nr:ABC transporter permease [Deltaproteobacteria bacterium]